MTQEDKELLLKDLCARMPYGVKVTDGLHIIELKVRVDTAPATLAQFINSNNLKYYLRPMKSMTSEEYESIKKEFLFYGGSICMTSDMLMSGEVVDWLNAHHFDYRGLIEKGLALEAPEGMYKEN